MSIKFNDKEYWSKYYREQLERINKIEPSPFAVFLVKNNYISKGKKLIELGCGNGRDSIYFSKCGSLVTAIDQCSNTTKLINEFENITSYSADFTTLPDVNKNDRFDVVYSRFTIHSIDEEGEDRVLNWAFSNLKEGGLFCIEARTLKDPLYGKGIYKGNNVWFYHNHHRRFIDAIKFKNKIEKIGFKIELFQESNGLAKYKNEDPIVMRLIAIK